MDEVSCFLEGEEGVTFFVLYFFLVPVHSRWCPDFEGTLYAGGIVRWPILCQMPISTASLCHTHATIKELLHGFSHRFLHSHLISWLLCWSNLWATWLLWLLVLKLFLIGNWLLNMQTTTTQAWECARTAWPRCPWDNDMRLLAMVRLSERLRGEETPIIMKTSVTSKVS